MPDRVKNPPHRRLRVYTFDPSLATQLDTALINQATLKVPWEQLELGPVGEYLEVVDYDPASESVYAPVDLNAPNLLAQDGHTPSEGNPQFHQQMVYAVAMMTIRNFEFALGRQSLWSPRFERGPDHKVLHDPHTGQLEVRPVRRLRIYPHALREANAYYSPEKKALLFGYFPAVLADPGENLPGGLVFTCLSQDVVAHETTHALLDGLHRYYVEPTSADALAFHEAFADIVALFQHFSQAEALRHQIARTRGDLGQQNLLGELAHQFGQAIGSHGSLRDAIGQHDPKTKQWVPHDPNPEDYARATEPHDRGAILVAASSTPSWRSIAAGSPTCCGSPPAGPAACPRARSIPTWSTAWPTRQPSRPHTSSRWRSGRWTIAPRWMSPSANISAPWSPATPT